MISTQSHERSLWETSENNLQPKGPGGGDALWSTDPATFIIASIGRYVLLLMYVILLYVRQPCMAVSQHVFVEFTAR